MPAASVQVERSQMHKTARLVMGALVAMLLLALAAGPASARTRVEVSTTATLINGRLTFSAEPSEGFPTIICDLTLHSTLLRLINKIRLEHAGDITAVLTANCRNSVGGRTTVRPLVPMSVQYERINGSLPANITGGLLWVRSRFLIESEFIGLRALCLYEGLVGAESVENPVRRFTLLRRLVILLIDLRGSVSCPSLGSLQGTMTVTPSVTIRLLER
jgi:hypothetical protein